MSDYVIPDIHGNYDGLKQALDLIFKTFNPKTDKIICLGDYVDRGDNGYMVLKTLYDLEKKYGKDTIICIFGNHDKMFVDFLKNPYRINSLANDWDLKNVKSFIGDYFELCEFHMPENTYRIVDFNGTGDRTEDVVAYINKTHKELLEWYANLPYYYDRIKEDNRLFIHAGIEETVLGEDWTVYTTKEQMIWKYPATYGENPYGFDIISGHIMTNEFWKFQEEDVWEIYKSGNHYYVDGGSPINPVLNVLKIDGSTYLDLVRGFIIV